MKKSKTQKTSISTGTPGLDDILRGGYLAASPTILKGTSGTGKTIFALSFAAAAASNEGASIVVSFDEEIAALKKQMRSLSLNDDGVSFIDMKLEPEALVHSQAYDLQGVLTRIDLVQKKTNAKSIVFDAFDLLVNMLGDDIHARQQMQIVFNWVRQKKLTLLATCGDHDVNQIGIAPEDYECDCFIHLEQQIQNRLMTRILRVVKCRRRNHGSNEYPYIISENGIIITPVTSLRLTTRTHKKKLSTGIATLDDMIGGKGLFKGSATLISGQSGACKSLLAATIATATANQGEKVLYCSFEESVNELIRNTASIGLNLKRLLSDKSLHIESQRSIELGLESHFLNIIRLIDEHKPTVLVLDPLTSFADIASLSDIKVMIVRLTAYMKERNITSIYTELLHGNRMDDSTLHFSSLIDNWFMLQALEQLGENNRIIRIKKSRGNKTLNAIQEFKVNDDGFLLENPVFEGNRVIVGKAKDQLKSASIYQAEHIENVRQELEYLESKTSDD